MARIFSSHDHYCVAVVTFSKVLVIDRKVIDNSLLLFYYIYCCKFTKYQVCLHVIPTMYLKIIHSMFVCRYFLLYIYVEYKNLFFTHLYGLKIN